MAITNPLHPLSPLSKEIAEQLREQMRRMLVRLEEMRSMAASPSGWMPAVDVGEMNDAILVRVEIPGVAPEHVKVTIFDNLLKIEGRKERATPTGHLVPESDRPLRFICLERGFGSFAINLTLKWPIDADKISAKIADGLLHIRLPKTQTCGKEITIPITE